MKQVCFYIARQNFMLHCRLCNTMARKQVDAGKDAFYLCCTFFDFSRLSGLSRSFQIPVLAIDDFRDTLNNSNLHSFLFKYDTINFASVII